MSTAFPAIERTCKSASGIPDRRETPHYAFIDALRGLAFLAVLIVHVRDVVPGLPSPLNEMLGRGFSGVQLFYVVSAFTLSLSLSARSQDAAPIQAYFLRRAFRIVPMFWFAILLYTALYGLSGETPRWGSPGGLEPEHLAIAALLLHGFNLRALNGVVPGGWSVATEVQFYVLLPLMLMWATSLRRAIQLWFASLALSIVSFPALEFALAPFYPAILRELVHQFAYYALPTQLPVFVSGLVLFRLLGPDRNVLAGLERHLPSDPRRRAWWLVFLILAIALPLRFTEWPVTLWKEIPGHIGYGILFAIFTYAMGTYPLPALVNPATRFFGKISYSGYLLHWAVLYALNPWISSLIHDQPLLHLVVLGGCTLAFTTAASVATFALIEQPGIALGRRLILRLAVASSSSRCDDPRLAG